MATPTFGQVIPVLGTGNGFPGAPSRLYPPKIVPHPVLATSPNPLYFGQAAVSLSSGAWQSVADFIQGGGTFTAALFGGVAIRNVTTTEGYPYNPDASLTASFLQAAQAECLVWGEITVVVNVGTPASQGPVYVRTALNASIPAGVVGGFEAAADGTNTVELSGVKFTATPIDQNNVAEISLYIQQSV